MEAKSTESAVSSLGSKSGAGVMSISTTIPPLPAKCESSGDTLQAIGRGPAHLMLFSSIREEMIVGLCETSTLIIAESSGNLSKTGKSSSCRVISIEVKSDDDDCTITISVLCSALGSYKFSGPSGIGSNNGSNGP